MADKEMNKKKKNMEFEFCKVCKLNHNLGRRHNYIPNHTKALSSFLSRNVEKLSDVRFFLKNPALIRPEHASHARLWCVFCDLDIQELDSSFVCDNAIRHLASGEHLKKLKNFLWKYGGGMDKVDSFRVSDTDLVQELVKVEIEYVPEKVEFGDEVKKVFEKFSTTFTVGDLETEKAFLKQPKVFLSSKITGKGKRQDQGGNRFVKSIGLGFKTPREATEEVGDVLALFRLSFLFSNGSGVILNPSKASSFRERYRLQFQICDKYNLLDVTTCSEMAADLWHHKVATMYSRFLLKDAKNIMQFALQHQSAYSDSLCTAVCPFCCSYSGYKLGSKNSQGRMNTHPYFGMERVERSLEMLVSIHSTLRLRNYMATVSQSGRFLAAAASTVDVKVWEIAHSKDGSMWEVPKAMQVKGHKGFSNSRFYAKPLAQLISLQGRKILQNTAEADR